MKKGLLFTLFLYAFASFAQNDVQVDLTNPNSTIYTHLYFLQEDSYDPEKAASTIYQYQGGEAIDLSIKLKKILDGKGLLVDFTNIPTDNNFIDSTGGYENKNRYQLFPKRMPIVSVSKYGDNWYYSKETIEVIDDLYNETYSWNISWLENLLPAKITNMTFLKIKAWQYLGMILILIVSTILSLILKKIIYFFLTKIKHKIIKTDNEETEKNLRKLARPITFLILIFFIEKLLPSLSIELNANTNIFLALDIFKTVFWIYVFLKIVQVIMNIYSEYARKTTSQLDEQLIPILHLLLSGIVITLGLFRLLPLFGMDVKAMIVGASIGGLALALASQDTVKNLLGTVMIFLDKPFQIGDWIVAGSVEGTVEEVGFRSSKIRAADTSIFKIPNSQLSEIAINNKGLRKFRRYTTELGIRYDTPPDLIEGFVRGLEEVILAHKYINETNFKVAFIGFGDSSLNIMVNVYFEMTDWNAVQDHKHNLHVAIIRLAYALKVDFAFPSSTLYMEQFPEKKYFAIDYNTDKTAIDNRIKSIVSDFKEQQQNVKRVRGKGGAEEDE